MEPVEFWPSMPLATLELLRPPWAETLVAVLKFGGNAIADEQDVFRCHYSSV